MDVILRFVNYLAWTTAVLSLSYSALTLIAGLTQTEMNRLLNAMHGRTVTYPWMKRAIPGVVAVLWLLANR